MKKILTIIGARPQIIKAAAISRAINTHFTTELSELILHTGQHYDDNMSSVFFDELNIPKPAYNLNVGSDTHSKQTASMLVGIEEVLVKERPNALLIYGDTNSTLAGALAASKMNVPIIHIEAGLRSFNKTMPEEINRIVADHLSTLLFTPTNSGMENLRKEGFQIDATPPFNSDNPKVYLSGDIMLDNSLHFSTIAENKNEFFIKNEIDQTNFALCTIHRNANTDDPNKLTDIFEALIEISESRKIQILLPLHPRTLKKLDSDIDEIVKRKIKSSVYLKVIPPASFLEMILLEKNCRLVLTDSGGLQKEAYYFGKPCVILRPETEWIELVESGAAIISDYHKNKIIESSEKFLNSFTAPTTSYYGDGHASEFICQKIIQHIA